MASWQCSLSRFVTVFVSLNAYSGAETLVNGMGLIPTLVAVRKYGVGDICDGG